MYFLYAPAKSFLANRVLPSALRRSALERFWEVIAVHDRKAALIGDDS